MKFESILVALFVATCGSAENNLRGDAGANTSKPLAKIHVVPGATIELLEAEDDIIIIKGDADKDHKDALRDALKKVDKEKEERDFVAFYKKLSGDENVPVALTKAMNSFKAKALAANDAEEDPVNKPTTNGEGRKLQKCWGNWQTGYLDTDEMGIVVKDDHAYSEVYAEYGSLYNNLYSKLLFIWVWRGSAFVPEGHFSSLEAVSILGLNLKWKAKYTHAYGDYYHFELSRSPRSKASSPI